MRRRSVDLFPFDVLHDTVAAIPERVTLPAKLSVANIDSNGENVILRIPRCTQKCACGTDDYYLGSPEHGDDERLFAERLALLQSPPRYDVALFDPALHGYVQPEQANTTVITAPPQWLTQGSLAEDQCLRCERTRRGVENSGLPCTLTETHEELTLLPDGTEHSETNSRTLRWGEHRWHDHTNQELSNSGLYLSMFDRYRRLPERALGRFSWSNDILRTYEIDPARFPLYQAVPIEVLGSAPCEHTWQGHRFVAGGGTSADVCRRCEAQRPTAADGVSATSAPR